MPKNLALVATCFDCLSHMFLFTTYQVSLLEDQHKGANNITLVTRLFFVVYTNL